MSIDQHLQNEVNRDMAWLDGPFSISINCPDCGQWLWDEDLEDFLKTCPNCGWHDARVQELPETIQAALGFMQMLVEKVECGLALTPDERQLLAQAATYAEMAG
jgi:predicted  nucleic acid-binding Zn-ribbon protein